MTDSLRSANDSPLPANTFRWDNFDAYLFDIDGTLLNCRDAVHYFAFLECLALLSGRRINLDGVATHGSTDPCILIDALTLAQVPESEWRERLPGALPGMVANVRKNQSEMKVEVLPGVRKLLQQLAGRGAALGVATGNLEGIGWIKLEVAGLRQNFTFGGFSDQPLPHTDMIGSTQQENLRRRRADIFRSAHRQALNLTGSKASVCAVGDTPADILAAREMGIPVIAVATGIFQYDELAALKPDLCLHSFAQLFPPEGN